MYSILMSINIELNGKEVNILVCTNILKMLERRRMISNYEKIFEQIKDDINNKASIDFSFDNKNKCSIYIINAKLTSIVQGTPLDDFLSSNIDVHKIIIIKECAKKVVKQIVHDYKNAEFFFEYEMVEDIINKDFIPEHQLLLSEQKKELLSKFNENELSIIFNTDMMSRYYGAENGDIFKIIRPTLTSGKSIAYRRVHQGSWDILFP
jgi:DNA-directed RNA polymerase subunit H (RpoH/RPB5)